MNIYAIRIDIQSIISFLISCHNTRSPQKIKIVLSAGVSTGRLVHRIDTGRNMGPRWLVTFDQEDVKDQELCEKSFGKLVNSASIRSQGKIAHDKANKDDCKSAGALTSDYEGKNSNLASKVSRGQSSNRRSVPPSKGKRTKAFKSGTHAKQNDVNSRSSKLKRKSHVSARGTVAKKGRRSKEECTKVPFLTCTLFLYRGENPRAVFVRKF